MTDVSAPAIALRGLSKFYGAIAAVRDLNLEVRTGEVFGFLGLNGAGKSTTIRILLDLLRATSGEAFIFGHNCRHESRSARAVTGYLPGELGLYSDLTGIETLKFLAGVGEQNVRAEFRVELQERLELSNSDLRRKVREYSAGMKRKLGLIQAMQHDPPLLILDEPTEGLDPLMRDAFYGLIDDARKRGRTIFMSSHILSEVERVCQRIAFLRKGELAALSNVEEICRLAPRRVRIIFGEAVPTPTQFPPGHEVVETSAKEWRLRVEGPLGPLLKILADRPVDELRVDEPKLEDVVLKYYRKERP